MKAFKQSVFTFFALGVVVSSSINVAKAAEAWLQTHDGSNVVFAIHGQDESIKSYDLDDIDRLKGGISSNTSAISILRGDLNAEASNRVDEIKIVDGTALRAGALANIANQKGDAALQGVATNGAGIRNIVNVNRVQDSRLDALENTPVPSNGVDGKDGATGAKGDKGDTGAQGVAGINGRDGVNGHNGKDGVTTTVTRMQVDTSTQTKVADNSRAITTTAQDLQATRQTLQAMNNNTSQQFKSLRDEVDNNKKQANAGISGAMAMAGLPQVQTNQRVMFSAGGATYNSESALAVGASVKVNSHTIAKVSFSDDTANNMGASVGVGIGL